MRVANPFDRALPPPRRSRRRRLAVWLLALVTLLLVGLYGLQFLDIESGNPALVEELDRPRELVPLVLGQAHALLWRVHGGISDALPNTNLVIFLKLAICTALAAAFLRRPRGAQ